VAGIVVGGNGKDAIVDPTINRSHHQQHCHKCLWLNPPAIAINNDRYCRR
jgi:hypothetical protein